MTLDYIKRIIKLFFTTNNIGSEAIFDLDIYNDLDMDSLGFVQLIVFCEDTFGYKFDISDMDFDNLRTINSISETIYKGVQSNEKNTSILQ